MSERSESPLERRGVKQGAGGRLVSQYASVEDRVYAHVRREGSCLIWTGAKSKDGYGKITTGPRKTARVHRFVWEQTFGPAKGFVLCHTCDTPLCINLDHLFLGSQRDNIQDSVRKGRHSSVIRARRRKETHD